MASLSDDQKREIGQHFVFGFHGTQLSEDIKTLIRDYHIGNIILFKRNVEDAAQVHSLIKDLQTLARDCGHSRPLLIGIDQENGLVSAFSRPGAGTQFPGAMSLAATGSVELTERVTAAAAKELKAVGINWAYSPVADINSEPRNPVIGVRSFGDDPGLVSQFVCSVSRGLKSCLIAPSAKHFPGHGDTHVDSHLSLPRILKTKEQLSTTELTSFRALIADGVTSIMTGHMALPLITGDETPCSLSRKISTELLREEMGYQGLVVTDCLEMKAVAHIYGTQQGAVMALMAGADIAMVCHRMERQVGAVQETYEAVVSGKISMDELVFSGKRIAAVKDEFAGTWAEVLGSTFDDAAFSRLKEEHAELSAKAYASSIALVRDTPRYLPLANTEDVVLFTPQMQSLNAAVDDVEGLLRTADGKLRNTAGASFLALGSFISERIGVERFRHVVYNERELDSDGIISKARCVVFVTRNSDRARWQIESLRRVLGSKKKVVVLASCAPYDLVDAPAEWSGGIAYLASFEYTPPALEAAVKVMFGEVSAQGKIPVLSGSVLKS